MAATPSSGSSGVYPNDLILEDGFAGASPGIVPNRRLLTRCYVVLMVKTGEGSIEWGTIEYGSIRWS